MNVVPFALHKCLLYEPDNLMTFYLQSAAAACPMLCAL